MKKMDKACRAKGGKVQNAGGNPDVEKDAEKRKCGGKIKRASGGRAGSDKSPFSSAAKIGNRSDSTSH